MLATRGRRGSKAGKETMGDDADEKRAAEETRWSVARGVTGEGEVEDRPAACPFA